MRATIKAAARAGSDERFRRSRDGFTLVEALVAFVILALVMVVLQRGVVGSVDAATRAKSRLEAGLVARTLLASPSIAGSGQPMAGRMNGHDWSVRFEDVPFAAGTAGRTGRSVFRPMRLIVEVSTSYRGSGSLTVQTIQLTRVDGGAGP